MRIDSSGVHSEKNKHKHGRDSLACAAWCWPTRGTYEEFMDDSLHKAIVEESMVFDVATNWLRTRRKLATREEMWPQATSRGGKCTRT